MSELDLFGFIGMNRSIFATFFLCGVLMPLGVVIIAYLFRNFPTIVRGGAMVSALIGVVMLTFFSMGSQNAFFMMLTMDARRQAIGIIDSVNRQPQKSAVKNPGTTKSERLCFSSSIGDIA